MSETIGFQADNRPTQTTATDKELADAARTFFLKSCEQKYSYNFTWLGRPVIQYPQDLIALQEIIWRIRPDLIVETGVAHGGSLVFYASMLELLGAGRVLGIDIDIRPHNREAIEAHPLARRIDLLEGSSVDSSLGRTVFERASAYKRIMVVLDSYHTHDHVLRELELYAPLVKTGSYLVVFDTVIEVMPASAFPDRPWGPGNNPHTAVQAFLQHNDRFQIDAELDRKLLISAAPGGYLRCIKG
ncbi:MAG: cephalosporin hydroxylase [Candidatus Eremiobacter antarcticus]|nr:cephalosporin hydroxylase family protein [Candidatus Eremiobacteraeota bacterium]MBC5808048.1 cephalosporin hydroxylase family protein [Candidatus Eremiobacteraeota bacterium]PZR63455.1 MAG: cephalosporin hydroxylase [Candidatus Eremiobacter sp. RRmetagenome_bin22]